VHMHDPQLAIRNGCPAAREGDVHHTMHFATRAGGSRDAPVARAARTRFAAHNLQRVRRGAGGPWLSQCTLRLARVGAAARPLLTLHDQFAQRTLCNGRDAARAGGSCRRMNAIARRLRHVREQITRGLKRTHARR